jgi:hypothetical protein
MVQISSVLIRETRVYPCPDFKLSGSQKREYDFSKGIRGKFYRPDVQLQLPVYLDEDVADFVPYSDGTGYGLALGTTAGAGLVAGVESRAVTGMNG